MRGFLLLVLITGCFATNGGTDCLGESPDAFFDPRTGQCIYVGSAEGCQCVVGEHRDCVAGDAHDLDLAACDACGGTRTEAECIARVGCVAQYINDSFAECQRTPPSGAVHTGACVGLDAHECSRRDYCALRYASVDKQVPTFEGCADEVVASHLAYSAVDPDDVFHR